MGTWKLVSIRLEQDAKKTDFYGPNPQGQATFEANGRVSVIITRSDLPRFASNNRQGGTPEENKAVVQGCVAFFSTYRVDEPAKTVFQRIEKSENPSLIRYYEPVGQLQEHYVLPPIKRTRKFG